jgi:branched-chain amino acid aminotransferase
VAFVNGEFQPTRDAAISLFDSGFLMGINVFDTLAVWDGWLFKLEAHLDRFFRSLHAVRLEIPYSRAELKEIMVETVRRAGIRNAYLQVLATRGLRSADPILTWPPTVVVYAIPYVWAIGGPDGLGDGVRVIIARTRNLPHEVLDPKIKTFNRLHSYLAKLEAIDAEADEVILQDMRGYLTEGRSANVFLVRQGTLFTPADDVLWGITRETVFEIAADLGLPAETGWLTPYDLYCADEAFFCTTAGGIAPIVEVDRRTIGTGQPGPVTRQVYDLYWQRHVDPRYALQVLP